MKEWNNDIECPIGKKSFNTEKLANTAMNTIKKHRCNNRIPKHSYLCPECNKRHLSHSNKLDYKTDKRINSLAK